MQQYELLQSLRVFVDWLWRRDHWPETTNNTTLCIHVITVVKGLQELRSHVKMILIPWHIIWVYKSNKTFVWHRAYYLQQSKTWWKKHIGFLSRKWIGYLFTVLLTNMLHTCGSLLSDMSTANLFVGTCSSPKWEWAVHHCGGREYFCPGHGGTRTNLWRKEEHKLE